MLDTSAQTLLKVRGEKQYPEQLQSAHTYPLSHQNRQPTLNMSAEGRETVTLTSYATGNRSQRRMTPCSIQALRCRSAKH
jgi:hypothetical protein